MTPRSSIFPSQPGPRYRAPECKLGGEGLGVGVERRNRGRTAFTPPFYPSRGPYRASAMGVTPSSLNEGEGIKMLIWVHESRR
jgi:hypothetical protein